MPVIVLSTQSLVLDKMRSNLEELHARGARIIAITGEDDDALATLAHTRLTVPRLHDTVMPRRRWRPRNFWLINWRASAAAMSTNRAI
jgi:glucosamine 6-phosphate synthetase-like amidotransferase/phosphosugar isomerase protein